MSSLLRRRRRSLRDWSAAAVTAAALYALPWTLAGALLAGPEWGGALAADVAVLAAVAIRRWSPLVVLAAGSFSLLSAFGFFLVTAATHTCGSSTAADVAEWAGAILIALPLGTWGVRRGALALALVPAGWFLAAGWVALAAHAIGGGTGPCLE